MADKKISALTAASTPLAGTEVLPIVQSGATVKVAVSDLTAGRDIAASSLTTGYIYTETRRASAPTYGGNYYIYSGSGLNTAVAGIEWQYATAGAGYGFKLNVNGGPDALEIGHRANSATWTVDWQFKNDSNLIPAIAGKGVNFTANTPQAGMTSQLLNWYEEGTFSPLVSGTTGGTATYFENSGMYTRMGNIVYFRLRINCATVSSMTGSAQITGLPFTCKSGGGRNIVNPDAPQNLTGYLTNTSIGGTFVSGSTILLADNLSSVISAAAYTNTFGIDITGVYNV